MTSIRPTVQWHLRLCSGASTAFQLWALLLVSLTPAAGQQGTLEQFHFNLSIREDAPNGTLVGEVRGAQFNPPYTNRNFQTATDNRTVNSFSADLQTGSITTRARLDREEQEQYTIILSTASDSLKVVIVEIRVLDINDVTPSFSNPQQNCSISESAPKGDTKIPLGSVRDEDLGENTTQKIEIVSGNQHNDFSLQIKNSSNVEKIIDLVVNNPLDFETTRVYFLVIRATDGGGRSSEMNVTVNIEDMNDNEPIFNNSKYSARISENATVGTLILQVQATDTDSGENSRITYSIDHKTDPEEYFAINATTGQVRVNKPLDFEVHPRFSLTLEARDNGATPQMGTAALDIIVENINEQPANVSLEFLPAFSLGHVLENTSVGALVAVILVDDPDTGVSADVEVSLYNSNGYFTLRKVDEQLGLFVSAELDRETVSSFDMTLQVTDSGNPPLRATKSIKIQVGDVNDNAPVFEKSEYSADVEETAEVGKQVLKVSATDRDAGLNARITYHIQEGSQHPGWFAVDAATGIITTRSALDCEVSPQPVLVIVAADGGDPPRVASAQVTISVRDVRDKEPEFETSFYSIKIAESLRVGNCFLTVSATDPECGTNSPVTYRLARMQAAPREFKVKANTGEICVQSELDYEVTSSYQFQVEAVDKDGLSSQAVVQVDLTDVNDNQPRFEPREYPINVLAGAQPTQLVTVQARDKDSGQFGTVTYSITEGNELGFFSVNANTGAVTLKRTLTDGVFYLKIQATDGGGLPSQDLALVTVSVITGSVHPPIFSPTMFNFTVSESVVVGQLVGQVQASLDDTAGSNRLSYSSLFQTVDWFTVDNVTGSLHTKTSLDRELNPFVVISIQAKAGFPPVYAVAQVNVTVLDVNDNEPYFPASTMLELEVREDEPVGTALYVARALDRDLGNNGTVRYRLHDQTSQTFAIDELTGEIHLVSRLDYEHQRQYSLLVLAQDMGSPPLSSNMTLTVKVKDVNDNAPKFDRPVYDFYVREDVAVGHPIDRVIATDEDSDHNKRISFSLRNNRYDYLFGISPIEGYIWTRDLLDRELRETYELTVQAVDHGSPPLSSTALIRIVVTDVNDNDPVFSRQEYRFSIPENLGANTLVGQVSALDRDSGNNSLLQYFFSGPQTNFTINSLTGEIRTQTSLDREVKAEHTVTVYVSDKGDPPRSAVTRVRVRVEDDNDNVPTFHRQGPVSVSVSENRPKATQVVRLVALDPDHGDNGSITYYFDQDGSEPEALANFQIHPSTGQVTTKEVLDYELQTVYHLTVVAQDGGTTPRQSSLPLTISVLDVNDQAPLFHARHVSFNCVENVSVGTLVGQVKATDKDSGENGKVNYYLVGGNVFSAFSVNRSSGQITTVREIDFEEASFHTLNIQAVDSSSNFPRSSNISVTINILDKNDNAPVFEQDPVIIRTVAENTPTNHVVHKFVARDRDSGVNGTVRYSIVASAGEDGEQRGQQYFDINRETGQLFVAGTIDFEKVEQISVIVKAEDACPFPDQVLSSLMTAIIFVTDVNDNAPVFESTSNLAISEEEAIGYMVLAIVAVDADSNMDASGNNVVSYQIVSGNEDGKFLLGQDSGYLSIFDALDYETQTNYTLNISAQDSGNPRLASFQRLVVSVMDTNDNPPIFVQSVYHANVTENSSPQTSVLTIKAVDPDTGDNGLLTYQIPSGIAGDMFTVDPVTGQVSTKTRLDRETKDSYTVTAYVKDGAYPVHYSSCSIIISVLDQNDNPPVFKSQQYSVQIPENRGQSSVLTLAAWDRDLGENGRISYSITAGNDGNFSIDPHHGDLSTQPLDRETKSSYNLTITASDHGASPLQTSTFILITVLDENDNSPSFDQQVYNISVPEDTKEGTVVLNVTARDPDLDQNGQVLYGLDSDTDGFFEINSQTGEINTSRVFDREKVSSFSFLVTASDNGVSGPRNSTARVLVTIADVNDNAPVFSLVPYVVTLNVTTPVNTRILTVLASDADLGINGQVEYFFPPNAGSKDIMQCLSIDRSSGQVSTNSSLQRVSGHYSVLVTATDLASPASSRLSSTGIIEITVGSGDSTEFQFSSLEYKVTIPENYARGNSVVNVSASFSSASQTSQATMYSIASGNENGLFKMSNRTGQVTVADPALLDYETVHQIRLVVMAVNSNYHAYANVWINLTDINDNAPKFSQSKYVSAIWENNQQETYVTQVFARDADSGLNGEIIYSIIGGNNEQVFTLARPHTGIVITSPDAAPVDREATPNGYRLTIQARDRGTPSASSTCVLVINIVDENDTPPFFPEIGPQNISESRDIGFTVVLATANDVDLNPILVYDFTADGNPDNTFSLDRSTGRLTLARRLDHEKKDHYSVGIQVTDGKPDHARTTWLDIYVLDENDNPPVFTQSSYQVTLPEQTGPQQSVLTVLATDADSGDNARVSYSMAPTPVTSFYINAQTGTLYTNQTISFISGQSIIQLVVVATDAGNPVQSSMVAVHIQITDVNKFAPRFLEPSKYVAHVKESAQRGHEVTQVSAIDEDTSHRGDNINYTLVGSGSEIFLVRQRTGNIFLNGVIDYEVRKQYDLTAVATDRGIPPKNASIPVVIIVDDENDNPPKFIEDKYSITLEESAEPLRVFLTVNATDADSGLNAAIKYSITSGNSEGIFLNPRNEGGLMIMERMHLDYETHPSHRLIIRAVDCSGCPPTSPRLSAFVTVDITVTDVNEFKPSFPVKHYLEDILENSEVGTVVFRAHANDGDGGEMGVVSYSLMHEYDYDKFAIDALTGDVLTKLVFDYEADQTPHLFNLTIIASDAGNFYDMAEVTIRLVDVDEFEPILSAQEYNFEVAGTAKAGDLIGQVLATDKDGGEAGRLVFSFLQESEYFAINPLTGNITVLVTLHSDPSSSSRASGRQRRALTTDKEELTIQVSSGQPGSRLDSAPCVIMIDRTCPGCAAPVAKMIDSSMLEGGVLAGIIVACITVIVFIVVAILFLMYRRKKTGKSVPNYSSDSTLDLAPPPQLPHDRAGYADIIRINCPMPPDHQLITDTSDQSHNSASSGRGSAEAEEEDEEISRINSHTFLHSSQAFRQKAMPDSGIQHDDDTLSEPAAQTHQEYLANLGIDSSKIGKPKPVHSSISKISHGNSSRSKLLAQSAESMHQFSDEGGGEGGVDTDMEKLTDLETDDETATLEIRTQGIRFHEPDTRNLKTLTGVVNSEEVHGGSYNWDYLIDWGPQYQPLAHVFSEIAKLKDECVSPKKQPIKTVPQRQYVSSMKQPQVRTVPPPMITSVPPLSVPATIQVSNSQNVSDSVECQHHNTSSSSSVPPRNDHISQMPFHHHAYHHNHILLQQQLSQASQPASSQAPRLPHTYATPHSPQYPAVPQMYVPHHHHHHHHHPNTQIKHLQFSSPRMGIHPHFHLPPPPQIPPPPIPTQPHHHHHHHHIPSSSGSRSNPNSAQASTINISLPSLPRSPISYESSLTSAVMTPSLTPSLSPLATRSPSVSPVVSSSGHTTPGKSGSGQNVSQRPSKTHSLSSGSEKEFTI